MVTESWFTNIWRTSRKKEQEPGKLVIGVLTSEVSSLMSKVIHLWHFLNDKQIIKLREDIMNSQGVRKLVSDDDDFLLGLACGEIIDNLGFMARSVAMLGKRCVDPVLQHFELALEDLINKGVDLYNLAYTWKKMEKKAKKMERFVEVSNDLYQELDVLAELEQILRRMQGNNDTNRANLLEFQQKVVWQRQRVKNLREISVWNRTYDYTVRLLVRSLFTIFGKIKHAFGIDEKISLEGFNNPEVLNMDYLSRSHSISVLTQSSVHPSENRLTGFFSGPLGKLSDYSIPSFSSGPLGRQTTKSGPISSGSKTSNRQWKKHNQSYPNHGKHPPPKPKLLANVGPLKGCMMGGIESPVVPSCRPINGFYSRLNGVHSGLLNGVKEANVIRSNRSLFSSQHKFLNALPSTLGASALALHYANVIIVIEKLVQSPHLIGPDARDDLYNMLPTSVRAALRVNLKSCTKTLASSVYDTALAGEWSEALSKILEWLAPLAHNMIRWQSERNFERQHFVSRTNVLLVQTLYFANQAKTEAVITELLVGLNYLWRFGRELNSKGLMECASNRAFDDYMDLKG